MSWYWNNHGLPFLPGYTFRDVTKTAFHKPQTLAYKNGYALANRPTVGIGKDPLLFEELIQQEISDLSFDVPDITFGSSDNISKYEEYVPPYVALGMKVLRFYAYFEEEILYSPEEECRIRPVVIYYYLEDDTMCVSEPIVENSGMPQGMRIKRQHLPKNEYGEHYHWKDLNVSIDLKAYGVRYRITHCDAFTAEFMEREGIILNDPEPMPEDPYSMRRKKPQLSFTTKSEFDRMHQYLTLDRKVLRFHALWENDDTAYGETRPVTIQYYLVDDTVEVREVHEANSGRDPFQVLMRRQTLPKKFKPQFESFPSCVLEVSREEVDQFYSPRDFQVGQTMTLLGRSFLLYDCDDFTKHYYEKNHPDIKMTTIEVPKKTDIIQVKKKEVPPYNGFGSHEDTLQNCLSLIPKRPKQNFLKMVENEHKVLRYSAKLQSQSSGDADRCFVFSYFLADDMISIYEKPTRNSGVTAGKFLEKTRVPKPGSTMENPEYYSPADLIVGSTLDIFNHRFVLTAADLSTEVYMKQNM